MFTRVYTPWVTDAEIRYNVGLVILATICLNMMLVTI
jgi:hypothetical protein